MKLHLPKMLTAALLAAFAVPSTFAGDIDQNSTLNLDDNITYNGKIWTLSGTGNFSGRTRTEYIAVGGRMEPGTATTPWQSFASNQTQTWGHTLRLTSISSDATATTDFSPYSLGGLIVEEGTGTHTLGRANSKGEFNGVGDVNLHIKGSATILGNLDTGITFYKGGLWLVEEGKLLTLSSTSKVSLSDGIAVNVAGKGSVSVAGNLATGVGATILVDADSTFGVTGTTTLGGTITNNGTVNFGGAVSLTDSLSGFESVENGHYVDYTGSDAPNGYYQGTTDYTLVKGNAASGLTSVTHGGQQYTVTDGKITVGGASDTDWTTYHLRTSGTSVNVGTELANNSQLVKVIQSAGTTVDLGGATLATLEGATSGAAMKLAGTGTISALTKTGVLDMQSGASVTVPNLTVADAMGTYSTGAGKLVMETVNLNANSSQIEFDSATQITTAQLTGGAITFGGSGITHSVTNLKLSQEGTRVSTVNVEAGATLHITGTAVSDTQPNRFAGSFSVSHWNAANVLNVDGTLISEAVVSSCDGTATINVNSGGRLEMRDGLNRGNYNNNAITINVAGGATLAAGTTHNTTQTKDSDTMVVNMATGSIFEAYYGNDDTAVINKTLTFDGGISSINTGTAAGKTMILNSNLSTDANLFVYGEGELRLAGGNNVLGHAIGLHSGTLSMTGTFNIDALQVQGEQTEWVRTDGIAEGSGFKKVSGTVTVVSIEDGTLNAAGATVTRNGVAVSLADTGVATLSGTANYTALWVNNTGAVSYDAAQTLADATTVETVHLNAEGATITMDKANASVALVLSEGINGGVNATAATTLSSVTGLGDGQTLTITGTELATLGSAVTGNKVVVDNGKVDLGALTHTLSALEITNGSTAVVSGLDSDKGCVSGTISIGAGSVLTVHGHHDAFGYHKDTATQKIVMGGTDSDHKAVLELNPTIQNAGTVTMTTDIEMNGYAAITTTVKGFNTYDCSITATGVENSIDQMYLRNAVTITVNGADGELTIGKLQRTPNFDGALTKEGEGKLVFNGTENVLDKAIIVNAGTLALDGTFSIGAISGTENASYEGGAVNGNGFKSSTTTRTVYTKGEQATVTKGQGAHFMVGEEEVTLANDGTATTAAVTDYTKFYVNSETETVSKALESHEPTAFALAASSTLQVDRDIAATVAGTNATSVVSIDRGKVLTGTAQNVTIAGSGTYALDNATAVLGTGVALDGEWAGIVSVTGASFAGNFSTGLSHEGSWIELKGTSGYLTNQTIANDIILSQGADGWAFAQNNGNNGHVIVFTGTLVGDGNLGRSNGTGSTYTYEFSGDISNWIGQFISRNNDGHSTTFKLSGTEAMEVGATLVNKGTDFRVAVDTDATFNAGVNATKVTVADGKTARFTGETTIGTIEGPGKVVVGGDATLTVTNSVGESVEIEAEDGATIAGNGISATGVGIAADATATFAQGITDASGVMFSKEGGVAVMNTNEAGGQSIHYSIGEESAKVTADTLTGTAETAVTVANEVVVGEIVNYGEGPLTLTHVDTEALQSIGAYMDGVTLQNVGTDPIVLKDITLLGTTVAVYQGTDEVAAQEGTVTITESLFAGGSTLLANLEMADGSTLNVQGGNTMALTLGSEFTIADGALVKLDDETLAAIAGLENIGDKVILIKQLEGSELTTNLEDGDWSRTHFDLSSITGADYKLFVQDGQIGLVKSSMAPEPTTGTLSLLALAALAARRRRK